MKLLLTVYSQCYSLKNSKMLARGRTIKHPKARQFERDFAAQLNPSFRNYRLGSKVKPLRAIITIYYPSFRQDLDAEIVFDCLQRHDVVSNDRWIRAKHLYAYVDKDNPRVVIELEEM